MKKLFFCFIVTFCISCDSNKFEAASNKMSKGDLEGAKSLFKEIDQSSKFYESATENINIIDSTLAYSDSISSYQSEVEILASGYLEKVAEIYSTYNFEDTVKVEFNRLLKVSPDDALVYIKEQSENCEKTVSKADVDRALELINSEEETLAEYKESQNLTGMPQVHLALSRFKELAKIITRVSAHKDYRVKKALSTYKSHLRSLQISSLPKMRKVYINELASKLWELDIEVKSRNSRNTTMRFIGGTFAANKNKQDVFNEISELCDELRFKRIEFLWYEMDDNYTYYPIKSEKDSAPF